MRGEFISFESLAGSFDGLSRVVGAQVGDLADFLIIFGIYTWLLGDAGCPGEQRRAGSTDP